MTKNGFLSKLNFYLMFKLNAKKRQGIIQDYKDFFAEGIANGETEASLCKKFGSPAEIAREVSEGENNKNVMFSGITLILLFFMALFLFSSDIFYITQISYRYVITAISIIAAVLCAKSINTSEKKSQKLVTVFFGVALISFLAWTTFLFNIFNLKTNNAGNILTYCYYFCSITVVIALYILIINIKNISKKFIILLPSLFFMMLSICELFNMMSNVTGPENFVPMQSMFITAIYIAPSLILSIILAFRKGKV